jgi:hypothetical protein
MLDNLQMSEMSPEQELEESAELQDEVTKREFARAAALWRYAGPVVQPMVNAAIAAMERHGKNTGSITGALLALIILCFSGIAAFSLYLGRVDTAEKILIALISFLGGAAMFSGAPKK